MQHPHSRLAFSFFPRFSCILKIRQNQAASAVGEDRGLSANPNTMQSTSSVDKCGWLQPAEAAAGASEATPTPTSETPTIDVTSATGVKRTLHSSMNTSPFCRTFPRSLACCEHESREETHPSLSSDHLRAIVHVIFPHFA